MRAQVRPRLEHKACGQPAPCTQPLPPANDAARFAHRARMEQLAAKRRTPARSPSPVLKNLAAHSQHSLSPHLASLLQPFMPRALRVAPASSPPRAQKHRHARGLSAPALHAARFARRAPLLIATKPVLMGVTDRRAPQLLHCIK